MSNALSFDLKFSRGDLEILLANPDVQYIITHGTYTYKGGSEWEMKIETHGVNDCQEPVPDAYLSKVPCPRPC